MVQISASETLLYIFRKLVFEVFRDNFWRFSRVHWARTDMKLPLRQKRFINFLFYVYPLSNLHRILFFCTFRMGAHFWIIIYCQILQSKNAPSPLRNLCAQYWKPLTTERLMRVLFLIIFVKILFLRITLRSCTVYPFFYMASMEARITVADVADTVKLLCWTLHTPILFHKFSDLLKEVNAHGRKSTDHTARERLHENEGTTIKRD